MGNEKAEYKPHKLTHLWQRWLLWDGLMQECKRHKLRLEAIKAGRSEMDAVFEETILSELEPLVKNAESILAEAGREAGPIWDWLVGIRGIGPHTAAKLLALFDDVGKFATVSKFWRFAGWAAPNGEIDRCKTGEKSPYSRRLKSECWLVADNFVRQQTPVYVEIYYEKKERQRRLHPKVICTRCDAQFEPDIKKCPSCSQTNAKFGLRFCNAHIDARARRKMIKIFLQHFWEKWRESEGLSVSRPYVEAVLGHTNIIRI